MRRRQHHAALMLAVAALLLTGCAPQPATPPPAATNAQITSMMNDWAKKQSADEEALLEMGVRDVTFVRFVTADDWARVMKQCADSLGAHGMTFIDGAAALEPSVNAADGRVDAYAYAACGIHYPLISLKSRLLTPQQLDYTYAYFQNSLVPCLRTSGVAVSGMPAADQFRVGSANGLSMWRPYEHLVELPWMTSPLFGLLQRKCPPSPPGLALPEPSSE